MLLMGWLFLCLSSCLQDIVFESTATSVNTNGTGPNYQPIDSNWILAWSDEFSESAIKTNTWTHETGFGENGWGNNELQNYTASSNNSYISNERLVIEARHTGGSATSRSYTSARMITKNKFSFKYGLVVARMKAPYGRGVWPAIWMLGQNIGEIGWPRSGEIDIFEMFGGRGGDVSYREASAALHYWQDSLGIDNKWQYVTDKTTHSEALSNDFHNYSLEWNEEQLVWRFNGVPFFWQNITDPNRSEFRATNFFLIANIAVGGNPVPDPDTSVFPQKMEIDWIRVYTNINQRGGSVVVGN